MKAKPHVYVTKEPMLRGDVVEALCGETIPDATWLYAWNDIPRPEYSEFVTSFGTCKYCLQLLYSSFLGEGPNYIYGVVSQQEGLDRERHYAEVGAA
jgi:hypothetical protein